MSLMKKFKDNVIRINEIADIYTTLSEMIDILSNGLAGKSEPK